MHVVTTILFCLIIRLINFNVGASSELTLVSRAEWLAAPPAKPPALLHTPVPYVIISHTATPSCSTLYDCEFKVKSIQTYHIEALHWFDIGYNFLVGGDGRAYEGRGWKYEGAHTYGYNAKSIGIAFIGSFNDFGPPNEQIQAAKKLIAQGVEQGYIRRDYKLLGHRQLTPSESPGDVLYEEIKFWDHWSKWP